MRSRDQLIDAHIGRVRSKLGDDAPGHIETVRGLGYRAVLDA